MIPLFDLHCDTLYEAYKKAISPYSASLHASLSKVSCFSPYVQVGAIWSDNRFDDEECFLRYKEAMNFIKAQGIEGIANQKDLEKGGYILAIEDARLICNDIERINMFKNDGIRVLTLLWRDISPIGGAWNTDSGLHDLGKDLIKECFNVSIIPDVSHASFKSFYDTVSIAKSLYKPIIASHSNSFAVCPHKRNLTDEQFNEILELNGLVGISLVPQHLTSKDEASTDDILKHIHHFLKIGGENNICLGCDFDGTDTLPVGIFDISDLTSLFSVITDHFGNLIAQKLFFKNAHDFFYNNLI